MLKKASDLKPGDVVVRVPYAGPERLPMTVEYVAQARAKYARIIVGLDREGHRVNVPVGHYTNLVDVKE